MEERLQKLMSHAGLGSRRECEAMIAAGRVTVNARIAELGMKADPGQDRILVDGRPLQMPEQRVYVALYKPRGVLSAVEADDPRQTVRDLVVIPGHLYPVGRLDVDSEGLVLLTNDGDLTNRLTHPRYGHEKEYRVLVARRPDEEQLQIWRRGVVLEDGYRTAPAEVRLEEHFGKGAWLRVILREGRKRQIRAMGSLTGLPVVKIIRLRLGSLRLGNLRPREWRYLTPQEIAELKGEQAPADRHIHPGRDSERKPAASPHGRPGRAPSGRPPSSRKSPAGGKPGGRPTGRSQSRAGKSETGYRRAASGTGRGADRSSGGNPPAHGGPAGRPDGRSHTADGQPETGYRRSPSGSGRGAERTSGSKPTARGGPDSRQPRRGQAGADSSSGAKPASKRKPSYGQRSSGKPSGSRPPRKTGYGSKPGGQNAGGKGGSTRPPSKQSPPQKK